MKSANFNKKVAKTRGAAWRKKLVKGKLEARMNPTRLRLERIKREMSQEDIAKRLKMSLATYGAIERGLRAVKAVKVKMISQAVRTPATKLFVKSPKFKNKMVASTIQKS